MRCFDATMSKLSRGCAGEKIPGFTVIVAMRQYSVELSVPMHSLLDDAHAVPRGALDAVDLGQAA
jgi:hypothetical protein